MKLLKAASMIFLLAFAAGCSSTWVVKDITNTSAQPVDESGKPLTSGQENAKENTFVDAIPFRMKVPHTVRLFYRNAEGDYKQVHVLHRVLPDMQKLYALNVKPDVFSDHKADISFREDGTIDTLDLKTTSTADTTVDSVTESMKAVTDQLIARKELEKAEEETKKAKAEADIAAAEAAKLTTQDAFIAAMAAKHKADALEEKLQALGEDASAEDRSNLRRQVKEAKAHANIMADRANMASLPFPEEPIPK